MPEYSDRKNLVEVDEFLNTRASATAFGMSEVQGGKVREVDGSSTPSWASTADEPDGYTFDGRTIFQAGDVFERQSAITEGPAQRGVGSWVAVGNTRTPEARRTLATKYVRVASNWEAQSAPGAPMKTANGFRMFDEAGAEILRPAIGEQDLSNVTGLPLWADEAETIPVLVTE